jgi:hypothetical protein
MSTQFAARHARNRTLSRKEAGEILDDELLCGLASLREDTGRSGGPWLAPKRLTNQTRCGV